MRASSLSPKYSELERRDIADLLRVHDFAKSKKVDDVIAAARERGLSATDFFKELYSQYRISPLSDRDAVLERMASTVPDATPEERRAAVRRAEIRALNGADAVLDLKREVKHREAAEAQQGVDDSAVKAAANPLQEAIRNLRHVDPTSEASVSSAAVDERARKSGSASIDSSHRRDVKDIIGALEQPAPTASVDTPHTPPKAETAPHVTQTDTTTTTTSVPAPASAPARDSQPAHAVQFDRAPIDNATRAAKLSSAPSKATMDGIIEADVRDWLIKLLGDRFNAGLKATPHLVDALRDGVALTVLIQKLRVPPVADDEIHVPKRTVGFYARDNVAQFLIQARQQFGLLDAQLFTDSDLCDAKDDRQVVTCLMSIARIAYQRGVTKEAPSLIMYEKEIEQSSAAHLTSEELDRIVEEARAVEDAAQRDDEKNEEEKQEEQEEHEEAHAAETHDGESGELPATPQNSEVPSAEAGEREETAEEKKDVLQPEERESTDDTSPVATTEDTQATPATAAAETTDHSIETAEEAPKQQHDAPAEEISVPAEAESNEQPIAGETEKTPSKSAAEPAETTTTSPPERKEPTPHKGPLVVHKPEPKQKPVRYFSRHWDYVDVALGNIVNEHYHEHPDSPWRFRAFAAKGGEYVAYSIKNASHKRLLFVRLIQHNIVVRQSQAPGGPVWMPLKEYLDQIETGSVPS